MLEAWCPGSAKVPRRQPLLSWGPRGHPTAGHLEQQQYSQWSVGLMDKASASGAGDSRLESWVDQLLCIYCAPVHPCAHARMEGLPPQPTRMVSLLSGIRARVCAADSACLNSSLPQLAPTCSKLGALALPRCPEGNLYPAGAHGVIRRPSTWSSNSRCPPYVLLAGLCTCEATLCVRPGWGISLRHRVSI